MKVRKGFVSNSSSSSFIIGLAKVVDVDKFKKTGYSDMIKTVEDLRKMWGFRITEDTIEIESFRYDTISIKYDSEDDLFIHYDDCYGDDSDFWNGDDYDYDVDLDFFPKNMQDMYELFQTKNIGLSNDAESFYGAGRDG